MTKRLLCKALLLLMASVAMFWLHYIINHSFRTTEEADNVRIQNTIGVQHSQMEAILQQIDDSLNVATDDTLQLLNTIGSNCNYSFYIFRKNKLIAWYDATLPIARLYPSALNRRILKTDNGWYYIVARKRADINMFALFRIKSCYTVSNDYLTDELNPVFGISGHCTLSIDSSQPDMAIFAPDGSYLFTASTDMSPVLSDRQIVIDAIVLILWMIFSFWAVGTVVVGIRNSGYSNRALIVLAVLMSGIYVWTLYLQLPTQIAQSFLFSSQVFAYDWWAPSLFYLLLFALMAFTWCYFMYGFFNFNKIINWSSAQKHISIVSLGLVALLFGLFIMFNVAINIMVYNSTDLAVYIGDLDVSGPTLIKILILSLLVLSFLFVLDRIYAEIINRISWLKYIVIIAIFAIVVMLPMALLLPWFEATFYVGFLIINPIYFYFKRNISELYVADKQRLGMRYSTFVWLMCLGALFITMRLTALNAAKEHDNRNLLINNLSFSLVREDDPVAETLLSNMESNIKSDTLLRKLYGNTDIGTNIYSYMRERYFDGYFTRYDLQVIPCMGADSYIQMSATGEEYNCYKYFENMLSIFGHRIAPNSRFYRLSDNDGSPSYFGMFSYYNRKADQWYRIYIEINQKQQIVETGYPELLTNSRDRIDTKMLKGYSYAKYFNGALQTAFGTYTYPRSHSWIDSLSVGEKKCIVADNYSHIIYNVTDNQTVVLSFPCFSMRQYLVDYSYIFLSMFIISTLVIFTVKHKKSLLLYNISIHERIQSVFVLFVIVLFIVICFLSAWESMQSFEQQSISRLNNTLTRVRNTVMQDVDKLMPDVVTPLAADNILQRATLSVVADAHFYSPSGALIGTSRRELFDNGIAAPLINSQALQQLRKGNDIFLKENIGHMEYFATYQPLTDINNNIIGYLSVPYFNDLNAMRTQIKSTIEPITTAYMIVILLAVLFSYFLAKGISKPLQTVSQKLRLVGLQHKNDRLTYPHSDEIGLLVSEYNRMVDELEHSAEQLAQSERETTWREMARQIAHEIKNPLTPMKLSVQYMIKAWEKMDADKFDAYIRRTSDTLVEQIDHLSFVASEFSNLAKTTQQGEVSRVDIIEKLRNTVLLYSRSDNATLNISTQAEHAYAMVNAEQIMSVFNNLIKNALQSVSQGQHVVINISASVSNQRILIKVSDNGHGISPEVQEKIFKPNFTTKSTGMGLGLAIVKTIVNNANGDIWFETKENCGTTFFVSLPEVG